MFWSDKPKFGLSRADMAKLEEVAEVLGARLRGFDDEVEALKARCTALESEVASLKAKPHQSLRAKLLQNGRA